MSKLFLSLAFIVMGISAFSAYYWRETYLKTHAVTAIIPQDTVLISVLDKEGHQDCHIPGSVHTSLESLDNFLASLDKTKQLIFYCSNYQCTTSDYAAKKAKGFGFSRISVYHGGIAEWYQNSLPVIGTCKARYLTLPNKSSSFEQNNKAKPEDNTIPSVITINELAALLHVHQLLGKTHKKDAPMAA